MLIPSVGVFCDISISSLVRTCVMMQQQKGETGDMFTDNGTHIVARQISRVSRRTANAKAEQDACNTREQIGIINHSNQTRDHLKELLRRVLVEPHKCSPGISSPSFADLLPVMMLRSFWSFCKIFVRCWRPAC